MKRLGALAALAVVPLLMAALPPSRPPSELQLFNQLNGQPTRWWMFDGGASGLFAAGVQTCFPFDGGTLKPNGVQSDGGIIPTQNFTPNVLMLLPQQPANICVRPQRDPNGVAMPWDGGCNGAVSDINFGVPVQPYLPYYVVIQPGATHVCGASDAGAFQVPAWGMQ